MKNHLHLARYFEMALAQYCANTCPTDGHECGCSDIQAAIAAFKRLDRASAVVAVSHRRLMNFILAYRFCIDPDECEPDYIDDLMAKSIRADQRLKEAE